MDLESPSTPLFCYDTFCDWIGGLDLVHPHAPFLEADRPNEFSSDLAQKQFFFSGPLLILEVLWLKISLFQLLSEQVFTFYQEKKRPLLNIHPDCVQVLSPPSHFLPTRWHFSLKLLESIGATQFSYEGMPEPFLSKLYIPPTPSFYSNMSQSLGEEKKVTVIIRKLERVIEKEQGLESGIVTFHVVSNQIDPKKFSSKDCFRVVLPLPDEQSVSIWATPIHFEERAVVLLGTTDPMTPSAWKTLEENQKQIHAQSLVKIFVGHSASSDLFSLGMMLFRTLLVNDTQGMEQVNAKIQPLISRLKPMLQGLSFAQKKDRTILLRRIRIYMKEEMKGFSHQAVLYKQGDRHAVGKLATLDPLWHDILTLGLRMVTSIPEFSFCGNKNDDNDLPLMQALSETRRLAEQVKIELFGSRQRNNEILLACDQVRQQRTMEHQDAV